MMFANHRGRIALYAIAILTFAVSRVSGDVSLVNEEKLRLLVEAMEAARQSIVDVRAELGSATLTERPGSPRIEMMTDTTWVSRGARFKYETRLSQLVDGKPPPQPTGPAGRHRIGKEVYQGAFSGEVVMSYFPERNYAVIRALEDSRAGTVSVRGQQEPLFYGLSVLGLSLGDIVAGKSWRRRPEDRGLASERVVKWAGTRAYDGREVHVVEALVRWTEADGTPWARYYEILVDPARGFTVPFISLESETAGVREKLEIVETECVEYGDGIWGPRKTVRTLFFKTKEGPGRGVTTTTVDRLELNTGVAEHELLISLPSGTNVDDQVADVLYEYIAGGESAILDEIIKSLQEAGFSTPPPLADQATPPGEQEAVTIPHPAEIPASGAAGFPVSVLILLLAGAGVLACIVVLVLRRRGTKTAGD